MSKPLLLAAATALFFGASTLSSGAAPGKARLLARLPAPVRQTIRAQLDGGRLDSIEKDDEDGKLTYDVEITRDGQQRDFDISADGDLLDRQVFLSELPSALQKSIPAQIGKGTLGDIYEDLEDDVTNYESDVSEGDQTRGFTFADDGRLLSREVFLGELPVAIQHMIKQHAGDASLDEIDQSFEDAEVTYDVQITRAGRSRDFSVGLTGELLETEVFMDELPAVVQTAVKKETAEPGIDDIYKSVDDGETSYDVDLTNGCSLTVDDDGAVYLRQKPVKLTDAPDAVRQTIQSFLANGKILDVNEVTEDGAVSYDVDISQGERQKSMSIGADGKVLPDDN